MSLTFAERLSGFPSVAVCLDCISALFAMNLVKSLLEKPFSSQSDEEKMEIKRLGPEQPDIHLKVAGVEGGGGPDAEAFSVDAH